MSGNDDIPLNARPRQVRLPSPGTLFVTSGLLILGYIGFSVVLRVERNHELIAYVEGLGGSVETVPVRPEWVRNLLVEVAGEQRARAAGEIVGVNFRFSEEGIGRMDEVPGLRRLSLMFTPATGAGLEQLNTLEDLETLSLYGSALDDAEMERLGTLTQLRTLDLSLTNISDEGLVHLSTLPGLRRLYLGHNPRISDEGIEELRAALPECDIDRGTLYSVP